METSTILEVYLRFMTKRRFIWINKSAAKVASFTVKQQSDTSPVDLFKSLKPFFISQKQQCLKFDHIELRDFHLLL